jgi:hypothetical protein
MSSVEHNAGGFMTESEEAARYRQLSRKARGE